LKHAPRRVWLILLMGACLVGFAGFSGAISRNYGLAAARAGEAAEQGKSKGHAALFRWINLFLLVGGLAFLLRKPLGQFFAQRSASIRRSLEEGRKALEASEAQLRAVEEKLQRLEEELAAFRNSAARDMEAECERLRQATAGDAAKILQTARAQMETATKAAKLELRLYAAQQAVELAQQLIRERLDDASRRRLVEQFLAKLDATRTDS